MALREAKTLAPVDVDAGRGSTAGQLQPTLRILFHPDLNRIGDSTPPGLLAPGTAITVGRRMPHFGREGVQPAGLDDPCVSRAQLVISCLEDSIFEVQSLGAREVARFSLDGTPLPKEQPVGLDTLLVIGDRVLLLLTTTSEDQDADRMGLNGESEAIWAVRHHIVGAAASDSTVLICGESGVGKELVARSIHRCSKRNAQPRLVVNCAAIAGSLLESELFGHVRGAFTGADSAKDGFFRAAGRGTLFLDEIGELPLPLQGKLLRVLQERAVCPVGGVKEQRVHARVIVATNRDLRREVDAGRFREDLYYRLAALTIHVPPLRERRQDIPTLFRDLFHERTKRYPQLERFWCAASQQAPLLPMSLFRGMIAHDWPGNVRNLDNVAEQLAVANLRTEGVMVPASLAAAFNMRRDMPATWDGKDRRCRVSTPAPPRGHTQRLSIRDDELLALLAEHDYVQRRVAQALGVSHTTIDRRMRALGLRRPKDLSHEEIAEAARKTDNDLVQMARLLRVSRRGLKLRMGQMPRRDDHGPPTQEGTVRPQGELFTSDDPTLTN